MGNEKLWDLVLKAKEVGESFQLNGDSLEVLDQFQLSETDFYRTVSLPSDIPTPGEGLWG